MKKRILAISSLVLVLAVFSCKENTGNKGIIEKDNTTKIDHGKKYTEETTTYKGTDGTSVKVIFTQSANNDFITFENGKTRIQVFAKEENGEKFYENNNLKVFVKGDSIIMHQNKNIIEMVKEK